MEGRMPSVIWKVAFAVIFCSRGCLAAAPNATCSQGNCPVVGYFFALGKNMVDKHTLRSSTFERFTVSEARECFTKCRLNCRCISFNYWPSMNETNCELNKENRHTSPHFLQPNAGAQYYDLVVDYNVVSSEQKPSCCTNGCCKSSPCSAENTLHCEELCDAKGKRFTCVCNSPYVGDLCNENPQQDPVISDDNSKYELFDDDDDDDK